MHYYETVPGHLGRQSNAAIAVVYEWRPRINARAEIYMKFIIHDGSKIATWALAKPSFFQPKLRPKFLALYTKIYGSITLLSY